MLVNQPSNNQRFNQQSILVLLFCGLLFGCQLGAEQQAITKHTCAQTSTLRAAPLLLSNSCLYSDGNLQQVSDELKKFTPNYQLWSDGAHKSRWIYLPADSQINTDDADRWIFPVGSQFFKEFRQINAAGQEIKVETRHLQKITPGHGVDSWLISSYQWNEQQTEAKLSSGATNVLGTEHDIPTEQQCVDCHKGNIDIILGFEAIQLSDQQAKFAFGHGPQRQRGELTLQQLLTQRRLTSPIDMPILPGNPLEQQALGYLHANCGNCHNPLGHAAEKDAEHLKFRHQLAFTELAQTQVYRTAVNQPSKNFTAAAYIAMGAQDEELALYQSAMFLRMNSLDENYRMPMIASERIDYQGLDLIHRWLMTLATPTDFDFNKGDKEQRSSALSFDTSAPKQAMTGAGLQLEFQFYQSESIPDVALVYWPEDDSLNNTPVMDQKDGYFSDSLIIGNKGSMMSLKNSDDVGHTIYVRDKPNNIAWQLNYMPPESEFQQPLFWEHDIFVELKCRLHLYMSAWVGSIGTKYHQKIELNSAQSFQQALMQGFPEQFSQVKIWLPKVTPIDTNISIGQQQEFELKKGNTVIGRLRLQRTAQAVESHVMPSHHH